MSALALAAITSLNIHVLPPPVAPPCRAGPLIPTASRAAPGPYRLGDLPDGQLTRLVMRTVDGCDVMEVRVAGAWALERTGQSMRATPATPGR